jgi:hypothetical protein
MDDITEILIRRGDRILAFDDPGDILAVDSVDPDGKIKLRGRPDKITPDNIESIAQKGVTYSTYDDHDPKYTLYGHRITPEGVMLRVKFWYDRTPGKGGRPPLPEARYDPVRMAKQTARRLFNARREEILGACQQETERLQRHNWSPTSSASLDRAIQKGVSVVWSDVAKSCPRESLTLVRDTIRALIRREHKAAMTAKVPLPEASVLHFHQLLSS